MFAYLCTSEDAWSWIALLCGRSSRQPRGVLARVMLASLAPLAMMLGLVGGMVGPGLFYASRVRKAETE